MKKLAWLGLLAMVLLGGKLAVDYFVRDYQLSSYQNRVRSMLEGMKPGGNYQTAVCMWYQGTLSMDQRAFNGAADSFDAWREKHDLQKVSTFTVGDVVVEKEGGLLGGGLATVLAVVDEKPVRFRVEDRTPIELLQ